jgi:hypothetical protein
MKRQFTKALKVQENELILAEIAIREGQAAPALARINAVRSSHGLDAMPSATLDSIYVERDKELFCTGMRLIDQRRFNKWHLAQGTWKFLPISSSERETNKNLQ